MLQLNEVGATITCPYQSTTTTRCVTPLLNKHYFNTTRQLHDKWLQQLGSYNQTLVTELISNRQDGVVFLRARNRNNVNKVYLIFFSSKYYFILYQKVALARLSASVIRTTFLLLLFSVVFTFALLLLLYLKTTTSCFMFD